MADRHQFRADWHDYNEGIYFVTICCAQKRQYFGEIDAGGIQYSKIGLIARDIITECEHHNSDVEIWNSIVIPNHIHIVIAIANTVGTRHGASPDNVPHNIGCLKPKRHEAPESQDFHHNARLSVVIGQIKSTVKRITNKLNFEFAWQPRFHEHIIRNQNAYDNIMNYIDTNVENWCYDRFNSNRIDNSDAPWRVPTTFDNEA